MDIISNLADNGSTIILCTHILHDVERVANKIGILRNGIMAVEDTLSDVKKKYGAANAVTVRPQYMSDITEATKSIEIIEKSEVEYYGDITFYAKEGVSEAELFYKIVTALGNAHVVPEGVWFKRMSLEQIYIGINQGQLIPDEAAMTGREGEA